MRARCKRTSDDSISKYNPNIIHRKPLTHSVTYMCRNPEYWFLKKGGKFVTYHKHVPVTLTEAKIRRVLKHSVVLATTS